MKDEKSDLRVGMQGKLISDLRPIGTAEFLDKLYEVQTNGNLPGSRWYWWK